MTRQQISSCVLFEARGMIINKDERKIKGFMRGCAWSEGVSLNNLKMDTVEKPQAL